MRSASTRTARARLPRFKFLFDQYGERSQPVALQFDQLGVKPWVLNVDSKAPQIQVYAG